MVWPSVCRARNGVWYGLVSTGWYGLAGKERCMVWPDGHGIVYSMAWRPWHDICYGLAGSTWYMVWHSRHRMTYGMAWRGMLWYVERNSIICFKALPWAIVCSHME